MQIVKTSNEDQPCYALIPCRITTVARESQGILICPGCVWTRISGTTSQRATNWATLACCQQFFKQQAKHYVIFFQVPPSLLLLSRTLFLPDTLEPKAKIAATISALPESAASATSAQIGEREGKIRNVVRLEQIKEEQRKIEEEEAEYLKAAKAAEKAVKLKAAKAAEKAEQIKLKLPGIEEVQELLHHTSIEKEMLDKAPILVSNTKKNVLLWQTCNSYFPPNSILLKRPMLNFFHGQQKQ